ncbi:MAG: pyruvate kinase [Thermoplasmata archaeon]
MRRTKILATVGPATASVPRMRALVRAGANALRVNASHGSDAEHARALRSIRAAFAHEGIPGAAVMDVQGPKLRIGDLAGEGVALATGARWTLDEDPRPGDARRAPVEIPGFPRVAQRGDRILLGDGEVALEVVDVGSREIRTRVTDGGTVRSHAGIFLPNARLGQSVLLPKDRHDIAIASRAGFDYLGLSFVRTADDVREARRELDRHPGGSSVGIIAKIERAEALQHLDAILAAADAVMVARGDLGIEVPLERLALEQKSILARANARGVLAIVATQMLGSMVHSPRPTRAEATDVANAVLDGADAVMLSEESAIGEYPEASVMWLDRICRAVEPGLNRPEAPPPERGGEATERSIAAEAVALARRLRAEAIVTPTHSGRTAVLVSSHRPPAPIVALCASPEVRRRLALAWGVEPVRVPRRGTLRTMMGWTRELARSRRWTKGPTVLTAGYPVEGRPTNLVMALEPARRGPPRRGGR